MVVILRDKFGNGLIMAGRAEKSCHRTETAAGAIFFLSLLHVDRIQFHPDGEDNQRESGRG